VLSAFAPKPRSSAKRGGPVSERPCPETGPANPRPFHPQRAAVAFAGARNECSTFTGASSTSP
jgi:hypothetical protein